MLRWCLVIACMALLLLAAPVHAETRRVAVTMAGPDVEAQRAVLAEVLAEHDVTLELEAAEQIDVRDALSPSPGAPAALARVWIDMQGAGEVVLYITDTAWERFLVRKLPRDSDELVREQIGQIVVTAVETLLAGELVGVPRAEVERELGIVAPAPPLVPTPSPRPSPTSSPPPSPPAKPPRRLTPPPPIPWRLRGAIYYEGQGYAAEQVMIHGPGALISIDAPLVTLSPALELSGSYRLPFETLGDDAGFRMESGVLRLMAFAQVLAHEQIALHAGAGAGIDILALEPLLAGNPDAALTETRTLVAPLVRASFAMRLKVFGETALLIGLGGDVDVIGTRYVVIKDGAEVPLVEPLRFRPTVSVGIATTLAGGDLFEP